MKLRATELGLSMQDCIDQAIESWLGIGAAGTHGQDCPLARASRDNVLLLEELLRELENGGELGEFIAGGFKWLERQRAS